MATLHLLGTGAGLSDPHRTTTMLAVSDHDRIVLIDCGGDVVQRMLAAGLELAHLQSLILTHAHPDHVAGFPLFIQKIWLAGRTAPLPIYGPREALNQAKRCFAAFDTSRWKGLPEMQWHETTGAVLDDAYWRITAKLVQHSIPTIGLRIVSKKSDKAIAYSCDTEPCDAVREMAQKTEILIHEATGDFPSHSTSVQAAHIAKDAKTKRLLLVHLPMGINGADLKAARAVFPDTAWGEELGCYPF